MTSRLRTSQILLWTLAAAAVLAAIAVVSYPLLLGKRSSDPSASSRGSTVITTRFNLVDHTGKPVTEKDYAGKWKLVFFGFTHCPDICPTTLNTVAQVMAALGDEAKSVTPLFITIDPVRDRPKIMAQYVNAFDKRMVGLTGTESQVAAAAKAFRAYYGRVDQKTAPNGYTMNHSTILYLMGPDGGFVTHYAHTDKAGDIARSIKKEMSK